MSISIICPVCKKSITRILRSDYSCYDANHLFHSDSSKETIIIDNAGEANENCDYFKYEIFHLHRKTIININGKTFSFREMTMQEALQKLNTLITFQ